jgi:hypothetical protein
MFEEQFHPFPDQRPWDQRPGVNVGYDAYFQTVEASRQAGQRYIDLFQDDASAIEEPFATYRGQDRQGAQSDEIASANGHKGQSR